MERINIFNDDPEPSAARDEFEALLRDDSNREATSSKGAVLKVEIIAKAPAGYIVESDMLTRPALLITHLPEKKQVPANVAIEQKDGSELIRVRQDTTQDTNPRKKQKTYQIGDKIYVYIADPNGVDPYDPDNPITIVATGGPELKVIGKINYEAYAPTVTKGQPVTAYVRSVYYGNLFVEILDSGKQIGVTGFVPYSYTTAGINRRNIEKSDQVPNNIERENEDLIRQTLPFWVMGRNDDKCNITLTAEEVMQKAQKEDFVALKNKLDEIRADLDPDKNRFIVDVVVDGITKFGVFCIFDQNNVVFTGLVHVSALTYTSYVEHPGEIVSLGQNLRVEITGVDVEKQRIRLSLKNLEQSQWNNRSLLQNIDGSVVKVTVNSLSVLGAYCDVQLEDGSIVEACLYGSNMTHTVKVGERINTKVIINFKKRKIRLSMKGVDQDEELDHDDLDE